MAICLGATLLLPALGQAQPFAEGRVVVAVPFGDGAGDLGRRGGDESAPEGPASFAIAADGDLYVLDQVHARVVRFRPDGTLAAEIPIGEVTFQDLLVFDDGRIVLLDRLAGRVLRVVDPNGKVLDEVALEGDGVEEGGLVTAMLQRPDGVWLDVEHLHSVRVLDEALRPVGQRTVVSHRLASHGALLDARIYPERRVGIAVREAATGKATAEAVFSFDLPLNHIDLVDQLPRADKAEAHDLLVVATVIEGGVDGKDEDVRDAIEVIVQDASHRDLRRFATPASVAPWEQFREFELGPDGALYQMRFTANAVEVVRWDP